MSLVNVPVMRRQLGFRISQLFSAGEQGAWYDPSDFSTMFQDAAGTIPVTAVGQPVGLLLDKSKGLALSNELVTNGTFDSNITGWTAGSVKSNISWNSGKLRVSTTFIDNIGKSAHQPFPVTAGKWYKISGSATLIEGTVTVVQIALRDSATAETSTRIAGTTDSLHTASSGTFYYYADTTRTLYLHCRIFNTTQPCTVDFDNVSVKEIVGNHATQSTSTSRPILSAKYNILKSTTNVGTWVQTNVTATGNQTGYNNSNSAISLYETAVNGRHGIDQVGLGTWRIGASGISYKIRIKSLGAPWCNISFGASGATNYPDIGCFFNLNTGAIGTVQAPTVNTQTVNNLGNGWWEVVINSSISGSYSLYVAVKCASANNVNSYLGNPSVGILIDTPELRINNEPVNIPPYQRVNSLTDYDTTGFPPYLLFDGIDDALQTASVNFTGTDKVTVWAGVRKLSGDSTQIIAELSSTAFSTDSTFSLRGPTSTIDSYEFTSRGTVFAGAQIGGYPSPHTSVLTGIGNISGDSSVLKINGVQAASNTVDQGTGNYGNYPLYIGSRGSTTLPFNGRLYSLIIRGAQSTATQISNTETYVNSKTGAY